MFEGLASKRKIASVKFAIAGLLTQSHERFVWIFESPCLRFTILPLRATRRALFHRRSCPVPHWTAGGLALTVSPELISNVWQYSMNPEISIIVPCLNEEQNIPILVQSLTALIEEHRLAAEILIVDDCSDDYTFREAFVLANANPRVKALHKGLPRGIGNAIRYGIDHALGKVGVVVMGDLVDPLSAIPDFRDCIQKDGYQLVLLSRYVDPEDHSNIPFLYRFYHFWYRLLCRMLVGVQLRDITYAFRGFDIAYVRGLYLESGGFEVSPEITLKTWLAGGSIYELKGSQGRRIQGESKFVFSRVGFGYARVLVKAGLARLLGKWPQKTAPIRTTAHVGDGDGHIDGG